MRDGTPKGYAFIHFKGNTYTVEYKVAGKPKEYQVEIFAPKVVAKGKRTKSGIYANFFMGNAQDKVVFRIDDGEWKSMTHVEEYDPSYASLVNQWDTSEKLLPGKRGSNPIISNHLWRGNIPTKLNSGEHTIEVKAKDMFGNEFTQKSSYRIEETLN